MNKKGFSFIVFILAVIGLLVVFSAVTAFFGGGNSIEKQCKNSCNEYDYEFFKIEESVYESTKCWCEDDNNKPQLVPWLKHEAWYKKYLPEAIQWLV